VTTTRGLTFAPTQRVIDRVHRDTTRLGAYTLPTVTASLADGKQLELRVPYLTDGRSCIRWNPTHLGGGKTQRRVHLIATDQLDTHPRAASNLSALTRSELYIVHYRPYRYRPQRQCIAYGDVSPKPRLNLIPNFEPTRRQYVALFAIMIVQKSNASVAIGIVLNSRDRRRNSILCPLEVDHTILLLVPTTTVAGRLSAFGVAAAGAGLGLEK
jgi:hypothetical protein